MTVEYSEKAPMHWTITLLLRILALVMIFIFAQMAYAGEEGWQVMALVSLLVIFVAVAFTNMRYELHEDHFEAWLWPFNQKIPYSQIEKVETQATIPWWAGMGIHGLGHTLYFNSRYGQVTAIHKTEGWWKKVAITPQDPEAFAKLLRDRVKKTKHKKAR